IGSTVQDLQGLNLLFQEVESNSQGLRGLVRQGETNVTLIASGFDVSLDMDTAKLRSPLSNVKLATYADFDDLVEAAAKLQKRWGKWMAKAG
ncbi:MAG: hypothetical protein KDD70_15365, partial [Bdellovibrionales bacterium]|nr:hypothetical protein [Bdellovibrionales bacterium]